jgi:hypothetical protein
MRISIPPGRWASPYRPVSLRSLRRTSLHSWRLRGSHSRLASLPAALGGDSRSSAETSLLLHRACYPQIRCTPGQRDRRNARPGFCRGRDFLQGGCYVGSSLGLGPIPCCSTGLGNRALSRRNHGVCHQSRSRLRTPTCLFSSANCKQRSLRSELCRGAGARASYWRGLAALLLRLVVK